MKKYSNLLAAIAFLPGTPLCLAVDDKPAADPLIFPKPGMAWEVTIEGGSPLTEIQEPSGDGSAQAGGSGAKINGVQGKNLRREVVQFAGQSPVTYYIIHERVFTKTRNTSRPVLLKTFDRHYDAPKLHPVSSLPGLIWVDQADFVSVVEDDDGRKLAHYHQNPAPIPAAPDDPDDPDAPPPPPIGPPFDLDAWFDAETGHPVRAKIDKMTYRYQMSESSEEPILPRDYEKSVETARKEFAVVEALKKKSRR